MFMICVAFKKICVVKRFVCSMKNSYEYHLLGFTHDKIVSWDSPIPLRKSDKISFVAFSVYMWNKINEFWFERLYSGNIRWKREDEK